MTAAANRTRIDLPVAGMDCQSCAAHIEEAVGKIPGVEGVRVLVSAERATITYDPGRVTTDDIKAAIGAAGYRVPEPAAAEAPSRPDAVQIIGWGVLGVVAAVVMLAALGEWLGIFDRVLDRLPWWIPAVAIVVGGWPVLRGVFLATRRLEITSHTLMTMGAIASIAIGEWTTAALIVFFMRFGEWLERLTTERNREALEQLVALRPEVAHVMRDGREQDVAVADVAVGEVVVVRPGERIPVDGVVLVGNAPVDQASITGESVPVDKQVGDRVFAATVAQAGSLTVRTTAASTDTTFARIVRLVEEAESQKTPVQRFADRFSTWYLPIVLLIGIITFLVTGAVVQAVAVLVVACACAITIATPVVVLASVGTAARNGLLIKGGIALEQLARVDTIAMDKTGTLTLGTPRLTDIVALDGIAEHALLEVVATVEQRSEHPLAQAMVRAAAERGVVPSSVEGFTVLPGRGVVGTVGGTAWAIGNRRLLAERGIALTPANDARAQALEAAGKTAFFVAHGEGVAGLVGIADTVRPEVKAALADLRRMGVRRFLLLTGDNARVAAAVAADLGVEYRAELLPEDKIALVKHLQAEGAVVMMVGDGINDAPALAQADVGVAMGAGTGVALEAADVALLRNDWTMIPEALRIGRRGVRTIRQNLAFTAVYNVVGLTLAAVGILPPVWAAAAQSIPDVAIMLNSARLLRRTAAPALHTAVREHKPTHAL